MRVIFRDKSSLPDFADPGLHASPMPGATEALSSVTNQVLDSVLACSRQQILTFSYYGGLRSDSRRVC
jgi:hypothetical protein